MTASEFIAKPDAAHEVALASRRIALLHIAYARTLVDELGDEQGRSLVIEAIRRYGERIGQEVRKSVEEQGLDPLPENYGAGDARQLPLFGMHDSIERISSEDGCRTLRAFGCVMGKAWNELGESELGRLYCLVDPAKYLAYDRKHTLAHRMTIPDGDPYCDFCVREASEAELIAFEAGDPKWITADRPSTAEEARNEPDGSM